MKQTFLSIPFKTILHSKHYLFLLLALSIAGKAQNYTWVHGSSQEDQNGIYGTPGVPAAFNSPGGREGACTWRDKAGNLWLFGGYGFDAQGNYDFMSDLWRYNPLTNQWTFMRGDSLGFQNGVYGTMGVAAPTNKPGGRIGAVSWTDNAGNLWLFGGTGLDATGNIDAMNDLWKYDPLTDQWTWVKGSSIAGVPATFGTQGIPAPANTPGSGDLGIGWTDQAGDLWLFGGESIPTTVLGEVNDLWKYNIATNQWTWVKGTGAINPNGVYGTVLVPSPTNMPGGRFGASGWIDAAGDLWVMGGLGFDGAANYDYLDDVWKYNITNNEWTWMKGSNMAAQASVYGTLGVPAAANTPGARVGFATWVNSATNQVYLFGGNGYYTNGLMDDMNDLWRYDPVTNQWAWIKGSNSGATNGTYGIKGQTAPANTPGSRILSASWTDTYNNLWLFGGIGTPASSAAYGELNDLWMIGTCTAPSLTITASQTSVCLGGSGSFTATGAQTYTWSTGATGTSISLSPTLNPSNYMVWGTSAQNCATFKTFTVGLAPVPTLTTSTSKNTICKGEQVVLSVGGASTYTWNTTPVLSGASVSVTPSGPTVYTVSGTNPFGCVNSATISQLVNACTGIDKEKQKDQVFTVYPNPSKGDFTVNSSVFGEHTTLVIFNALGQKVLQQELSSERTHVDTDLQRGVYYYQVIHENAKAQSGKLIVD